MSLQLSVTGAPHFERLSRTLAGLAAQDQGNGNINQGDALYVRVDT